MKINFYLRDETKPKSSVQVLITHAGKVYRRQAGFYVRTDRWKKPKSGIQTSTDPKVADRLKEIRLNLEARLSDVSTPKEILAALDEVVSGESPVRRSSAPGISQQKLNENIKSVCRKANIREYVTVTRSSGTKHFTERHEKCDLVTSHTARRTGATLLYMSGVPLKQCMMITGHTTETSFMKYIRVSKEENAELLASNPFFTRV